MTARTFRIVVESLYQAQRRNDRMGGLRLSALDVVTLDPHPRVYARV